MKKAVAFVVLLAVAIVGYAAAGPYIAIQQVKGAVQAQDAEKLSERIDFPTLRQNLKEQFKAAMLKEVAAEVEDNPFAGLAMGFGTVFVEGMVDAVVTPAGLANLMAGEKPEATSKPAPEDDPASSYKKPFESARYSYDSANKFSAWVAGEAGQEIRFVLTRSGLAWRLSNIVIPMQEVLTSAPKTSLAQANAKKAKEPAPIGVTLLNKGFRDSDWESGVYEEAITFAVSITNLTSKDIRAFDGILRFTDLLDNSILSSSLAINDPVAAGSTLKWEGQLDYNEFMDSHERLRGEKQTNLKINFSPRKVLFADGTSKEYE